MKFTYFFIVFIATNKLFSQDNSQDFIVTMENDTIFCFITDISNFGGKTTHVNYKDENGKIQTLKGKDVKEFLLSGYNMVQIPLNPKKPDGYTRHYSRIYNKSIQIFNNALYASIYYPKKDKREVHSDCPSCVKRMGEDFNGTILIHSVRLPNGKYCAPDGKSFKEDLEPFLMKCAAVKEKYPDGISDKNGTLEIALELYIKNCDN